MYKTDKTQMKPSLILPHPLPPLVLLHSCIYSQDWTTPDASGDIKCGAAQHTTLMHHAPARGGMVALALAQSQHNSCSDIPSLFADSMGWFLKHLGFVRGEVTPLQQLLRNVNAVLVAMEGLCIGRRGLLGRGDWRSAGLEVQEDKVLVQEGELVQGKEEETDGVDEPVRRVTSVHAARVQACFETCCSMMEIVESTWGMG